MGLRAALSRARDAASDAHWRPGYYPRQDDAYAIAALRGGRAEVATALLGRLISGGHFEVQNDHLAWRNPDDPQPLTPIEEDARQALAAMPGGVPAHEAKSRISTHIAHHLPGFDQTLRRQGLIPTPEENRTSWLFCLGTIALVCGIGFIKVLVAAQRGRPNIGFLLLMMLFYAVAGILLLKPSRLTAAGKSYLAWLQESHRGLIGLVRDDRRTGSADAAILAGIYGMAVLPSLEPIHLAEQRQQTNNSSSGSGCGGGDSGGGDGGGGGCGGCGGS